MSGKITQPLPLFWEKNRDIKRPPIAPSRFGYFRLFFFTDIDKFSNTRHFSSVGKGPNFSNSKVSTFVQRTYWKVHINLEYHTVSSSELGPPTPSTASECVPLFGTKGGEDILYSHVGEGLGGPNCWTTRLKKKFCLLCVWNTVLLW